MTKKYYLKSHKYREKLIFNRCNITLWLSCTTVYVNEILAERIELVKTVENSQNTTINTLASAEKQQGTAEDPFKDFGEEIVINPEDLPF